MIASELYPVDNLSAGRAKRGWTSQHKEVRSKPIHVLTCELAGKAERPSSGCPSFLAEMIRGICEQWFSECLD